MSPIMRFERGDIPPRTAVHILKLEFASLLSMLFKSVAFMLFCRVVATTVVLLGSFNALANML